MMTEAEMDKDVADAAAFFRGVPSIRVDRCRHPSITKTALWFFNVDGKRETQIASATRMDGTGRYTWNVQRMYQSLPVAQRCDEHLTSACSWVLEYAANNTARLRA